MPQDVVDYFSCVVRSSRPDSDRRFALVVPYRAREEHLKRFVPYMIEYLQRWYKRFALFVVEQAGHEPFNRGRLLNVGFNLAEGFDYVCFHDVDMLPHGVDYGF